jgi:hypothetical protein
MVPVNNRNNLSLWLRWVLVNSIGEMIGLGATFAIGFVLFSRLGEPQGVLAAIGMALLMTSSGLLEGAVVGLAQWLVMYRSIYGISRRAWVMATIIGALVAWALGSLPMTMASLGSQGQQAAGSEPPAYFMFLMEVAMGLVAGSILGLPQWAVLRQRVEGAWLWIPANSIAWAIGMPMVFAGVDLAQKVESRVAAVVTMALVVAITGAVVGAVHGLALVKLTSEVKVVKSAV